MKRKKPAGADAERAAELLGLKVYDLAVALRAHARVRYIAEANRVKARGVRPNHKLAGELLAAAEACDESLH